MHDASYKTETREVPARSSVTFPLTAASPTGKPATADRPASPKSVAKPGLAAAHSKAVKVATKNTPKSVAATPKKAVAKPTVATAKPVTKPVRIAKIDPLAPLPAKHLVTSKGKTADR
jgi:hypothetical protein